MNIHSALMDLTKSFGGLRLAGALTRRSTLRALRTIAVAALLSLAITAGGLHEARAQQAEPSAALQQNDAEVDERPVYRIGLVTDAAMHGGGGESALVRAFTREARRLMRNDARLQAPDSLRITTGGSMESVRAAIDTLSVRGADVIVADGPLASLLAPSLASGPPLIAASVWSPSLWPPALRAAMEEGLAARLPTRTFVASPDMMPRNLALLDSVTADPADPLAVLAPEYVVDGVNGLADRMTDWAEAATGRRVVLVPVPETPDAALRRLPADAQAAYVFPQPHLSPASRDRLYAGLNARRLPAVVHEGEDGVRRGGLLTQFAATETFRARRIAGQVRALLVEESGARVETALRLSPSPLVNAETARRLGIDLPTMIAIDVETIGEPETASDSLGLASAIDESMNANLQLRAARAGTEATRQAVQIERADFLPQIGLSGRARRVNEERAAASFGADPEDLLRGSVSVSQTIFSASDLADLDVAKRRTEGAEATLDASRQDVAFQTAVAYVGVLRARAVARVQRENLALARENLALVEARREVGQVGRQEVLRFQTQIAQTRRALLAAEAGVRTAKNRLKQFLARPLDGQVTPAALSANADVLLLTERIFAEHARSPQSREALTQFFVAEGLANAPELRALDAEVGALDRRASAARQSYYAPELAIEGGVSRRLIEGGAGTEPPQLPASLGDVGFPRPPKTNWEIGLSLRFPVFSGLRRDGQIDRVDAERRRAEIRRADARRQLEEAIRSQTDRAAAAYLGVIEAEAAASAGRETLDLVQESYARGVADVLDLIDTQGAVLQTRLELAGARYDFLLRLLETERALSRVGALQTPQARNDFRARLQARMRAAE